MYDIEKIKNDIRASLSEYRYNHSLMVAEEARKLALHYGLDSEKAYVTGLVHDIAKEFSDEENLKWIQKYNLPNELLAENLRPVIHADIGAVVVKELYNFDDEMCNSIKYHSIGNYPMTLFEKIIFVADKIARDKPNDESLKELQALAYKDIDAVLLKCLEYSKAHLEKNGNHIEPITQKLLDSLKK